MASAVAASGRQHEVVFRKVRDSPGKPKRPSSLTPKQNIEPQWDRKENETKIIGGIANAHGYTIKFALTDGMQIQECYWQETR